MRLFATLGVLAAGFAAGCTTDDTMRIDGLSYGAGDAIAANTVMQMVDPWQDGVQDTDLEVPAERPAATASAPEGGSAPISAAGAGSDN
ncbi:MAG: hypothetical protein AB7I79_10745 [Rhizobiaceae bacterium]